MNLNKLKISDMAFPRALFIARVESYLVPITIHLCLIQSSEDPELLKHWKSEIKGLVNALQALNLKGSNSKDARLSAINQAYTYRDIELANTKYLWADAKFEEEGLESNLEWFESINSVVNDLLSSLKEALASKTSDSLKEWINNL